MTPPSDHSLRIGRVFARLLVVEYINTRHTNRGDARHHYLCRCDCGNTTIVEWHNLRGNHTRSCGCLAKEGRPIHGHASGGKCSATYISWMSLFSRCYNPKDKRFIAYGGRGINVCERWRESFSNFLDDMGERPIGTSLDRIDPNGNYDPGNCRWATQKEQQRNRRNNVRVTINGETRCISEWLEVLGMPRSTLDKRRRAGFSLNTALTAPIRTDRKPIKEAA